jgi:hypothetical protein
MTSKEYYYKEIRQNYRTASDALYACGRAMAGADKITVELIHYTMELADRLRVEGGDDE